MVESIKIANIEVASTTKKSVTLEIGSGPLGLLGIPVTIINGSDDGPILCVTAGTHGCEFAGIVAVAKLIRQIQPKNLNGALVAVPVVNPGSFANRTPYVNPIDNINIEQIYPGDSNGSISQRIAAFLLEELVGKADFAIDCHGGDLDEIMMRMVWFAKVGNKEVDLKAEAIARAYGFEYVCQTEESSRLTQSGKKGVSAIQAECGRVGIVSETDVAYHYTGITNVMKYLEMIDGKPVIEVCQKLALGRFLIRATCGGLFLPMVKISEIVTAGQIVGEIQNLQGEVIDRVMSPENGVIRKIFTHLAVTTGRVVMEGHPSPQPEAFALTDSFTGPK